MVAFFQKLYLKVYSGNTLKLMEYKRTIKIYDMYRLI